MHERIQDSLTYARNFGGADSFITFTCKPTWDDIMDAIKIGMILLPEYFD